MADGKWKMSGKVGRLHGGGRRFRIRSASRGNSPWKREPVQLQTSDSYRLSFAIWHQKWPWFWIAFFLAASTAAFAADRLDPHVGQLLVSIAPGWDSMHGKLWRLERREAEWETVVPPVPVLFGKHGLAWGRGEIVGHDGHPVKVERDGRAPAGVFRLGTIYTYDQDLPAGATYPHYTVGPGDAWVDDVNSPDYNRHVAVDPDHPPPWFSKNRMRQGDFAYRWLVEIRHNADPPTPGFGSAIFFHIQRGPDRPSAGCTTMAGSDLVSVIKWLRADKHPRYVCLPKPEYFRYWKVWDLPKPSALGLSPE